MIILYLSYIVLIYLILNFYKNNIKHTEYIELLSAILICVGIYIINLVFPTKLKEKFGNKKKKGTTETTQPLKHINEACSVNQECHTRFCSSNKCGYLKLNKSRCAIDDECESKHCFSKICRTKKDSGQKCTQDRDCNTFDFKKNKYNNNNYCGKDSVCRKVLK